MKRLTREQKRRTQRVRANVTALSVVAAIFATGFVAGRCTRAQAAEIEPTENKAATVEDVAAPAEIAQVMSEVEIMEPGPVEQTPAYYPLSEEERDLVARVVTAEAGGEDYDGQRLVAQCLLNACLLDGIRPEEVVEKYQYATGRPEPTESVLEAVSAVFDRHEVVTDELILWFYAPARAEGKFHNTQRFVLEHGGHRFFAPLE